MTPLILLQSLLALLLRPFVPALFEPIFRILIVYKSGAILEFDCTAFKIKNTTMEWHGVGPSLPLQIGIDEIAAVWQVGQRWQLKRTFKL